MPPPQVEPKHWPIPFHPQLTADHPPHPHPAPPTPHMKLLTCLAFTPGHTHSPSPPQVDSSTGHLLHPPIIALVHIPSPEMNPSL